MDGGSRERNCEVGSERCLVLRCGPLRSGGVGGDDEGKARMSGVLLAARRGLGCLLSVDLVLSCVASTVAVSLGASCFASSKLYRLPLPRKRALFRFTFAMTWGNRA